MRKVSTRFLASITTMVLGALVNASAQAQTVTSPEFPPGTNPGTVDIRAPITANIILNSGVDPDTLQPIVVFGGDTSILSDNEMTISAIPQPGIGAVFIGVTINQDRAILTGVTVNLGFEVPDPTAPGNPVCSITGFTDLNVYFSDGSTQSFLSSPNQVSLSWTGDPQASPSVSSIGFSASNDQSAGCPSVTGIADLQITFIPIPTLNLKAVNPVTLVDQSGQPLPISAQTGNPMVHVGEPVIANFAFTGFGYNEVETRQVKIGILDDKGNPYLNPFAGIDLETLRIKGTISMSQAIAFGPGNVGTRTLWAVINNPAHPERVLETTFMDNFSIPIQVDVIGNVDLFDNQNALTLLDANKQPITPGPSGYPEIPPGALGYVRMVVQANGLPSSPIDSRSTNIVVTDGLGHIISTDSSTPQLPQPPTVYLSDFQATLASPSSGAGSTSTTTTTSVGGASLLNGLGTVEPGSISVGPGSMQYDVPIVFRLDDVGVRTIKAVVDPFQNIPEVNFGDNIQTMQVMVGGAVDLTVSNISLFQPAGTPAVADVSSNPIVGTITPSTANPAPKVPAVQAVAQVTVNMSGTPSGTTATDLQLKLGSQVIADQPIDISQLQQGDNVIAVNFTPPTDPSLLGVQSLTATVNASQTVQETDYTNNSFNTNINTMVLCKVEDAGTLVPFHSQAEMPWAPQPYGIPDLSSGTFRSYGCSVTDLYMLFSSYGITNTPIGSPADPAPIGPHLPGLNGESLDPGTLNSAMANYTTDFLADGSVGFDANNNPIWAGAAEVARAGYQAQCQLTGACDPANAFNVVSFKGLNYSGFSAQDAITAVQNEICSGNPVIMKFAKDTGGQHFMLATGIALDKDNNNAQTLRLNNPGTVLGKDTLYDTVDDRYPSVIGYVLYHPSADPSMMLIAAPMGVHFVVTDPLGRRAGFNPNTGTSYAEIPGAAYGEQSIDTPAEPGFTPSTAVDERYFMSSQDVPPGSYNIQVFSLKGGSYYLDYRSFDASGMTNDSHFNTGTLAAGNSATVAIKHVTTTVPRPNAVLAVSQYAIQDTGNTGFKQAMVKVAGTIVPNSTTPVSIKSSVQVTIGGITGYQFYLPASNFTSSTASKKTLYIANSPTANVHMDSTGVFEIDLRGVDLSTVDQNLLGSVRVEVDSTIGAKKVGLTCHQGRCSN